jgi:Icc-related predicted phosphoesterase
VKLMKILLLSDLEGRIPKGLKKFVKREKINAIISAGDFSTSCTKMIFENWDLLTVWDKEAKKEFDKRYGFSRVNKEIKKGWKEGVNVLRFLNSLEIPVYVILGNQDFVKKKRAGAVLNKDDFHKPGSQIPKIKKMKNLIYLHNNVRKLGLYNIVGFNNGYTRTIKNPQKKLFKKPFILVTHSPPKGTKFGKIKNKKSPRNGDDVGSKVTAKLIKKYKPVIHISGHMHEHRGWTKIGKTIVIASGFGYDKKGMLLELKGEKIKIKKVQI